MQEEKHFHGPQPLVLRRERLHYNLPTLPPHYQPRPAALDASKAKLLACEGQTVGITGAARAAGLRGMGGIGKTVLATALVHDKKVQAGFPSGIVWLTFGRDANVVAKQAELAFALTGVSTSFRDAQEGRGQLGLLMSQLRQPLLIVLDDVWQPEATDGFSGLASMCRLLVTTRDRRALDRLGADEQEVGLLDPDDARVFLSQAAGTTIDRLPSEADEVLKQCGRLPLALAAVGALIRKSVFNWTDVTAALREAALDELATDWLPDCEQRNVAAVLKVSVDALSEEARACFYDYSVFRQDVAVPEETLVRIWAHRSGRGRRAKLVAQELVDRSLLRRDEERRYFLHDLYHDYLRQAAGALDEKHAELLKRYRQACPRGFETGPDDGYFFQNILWHLHELRADDEIRHLLFDLAWLCRKIEVTRLGDLVLDCGYLPGDPEAERLAGVLRLSAHVLTQKPKQLCAQLCGRLGQEDGPSVAGLLARARASLPPDVMIPRFDGFLDRPGALVRVFRGHSAAVAAVAALPDGRRAVSGAADCTLRLWDLETGETLRTFGDSAAVEAVAVLPDGQLALSGARDGRLRLWNLETGETLRMFDGHSASVGAVAVLSDGRRALSGAADTTLRLWDLETGETLRILRGHWGDVRALAMLPDGRRALSGAWDGTLRLWDLMTGKTLRMFDSHGGEVRAVVVLPDGRRALSSTGDRRLRLWDLEGGGMPCILDRDSGWVDAVAVLPDGQKALSGSSDRTLRLRDTGTGETVCVLDGHSDTVRAVAVLPDGRRGLSGAQDGTLRLWDLERQETLRTSDGHSGPVMAVAVLPDGRRALSGAWDATLRLWDLETGETLRTLRGHTSAVMAMAVLPDGRRALSGAWDKLRLWDLETGATLRTLQSEPVSFLTMLPDGHRVLSGARNTLRLWDLETGETLRVLDGDHGSLYAVAVMPSGRLALAGAKDGTLRLLDLETGGTLRILRSHTGAVMAVAVLRDGRRALSGAFDGTLRLWDLETGETLRIFHGHGAQALALLPDGHRLLSGGWDGTLRLWDLETGGEIVRFVDDHEILSCATSLNSPRIVAGNARGRVLFFDASH